MKYRILLFSLIVFISLKTSVSQDNNFELGSPFITNYSSEMYYANPQNWSISQDGRGVMYFGNTDGTLIFDGIDWKLQVNSNISITRSLFFAKDKTVYVGANREFGYIAVDSIGEQVYISLIEKLAFENRTFNDVHKILETTHGIYFITLNEIFLYSNEEFTTIPFNSDSRFGFLFNDYILLVAKEGGIYMIDDTDLELIPDTKEITTENNRCVVIPKSEHEIFIITENNGMFVYDLQPYFIQNKNDYNFELNNTSKNITQIKTEVATYITANELYCGIKYHDNEFIAGTVTGGLIFFDQNGNLLRIINKERGLQDDCILDIYADSSNNLWVALLNGISYIELQAPISYYSENENLTSSVYFAGRYKNKLMVGTSQGLFYLPEYFLTLEDDDINFKKIAGLESGVWEFVEYENYLLIATRDGVAVLKDTTILTVYDIGQCYSIHLSPIFKNLIFIGLADGFSSMKIKESSNSIELEEISDFEEITSAIRKIITIPNEYRMWLTSSYNGIYRIDFLDNKYENYQIEHYDTAKGLPRMNYNYVNYYNNQFFLTSAMGIYTLNQNNFFERNNIYKNYISDSAGITDFVFEDGNIYLLDSSSQIGYFNRVSQKFIKFPFNKIKNFSKYNIHVEKNILWSCTNKGLYRYDLTLETDYNKEFNTILRLVTVGKDSVIYGGSFFDKNSKKGNYYSVFTTKQPLDFYPELAYKNNSITFKFSSTFYENIESNLYSYFLEGFDNDWSEWKPDVSKEYNYLREGDYIFHVKSKNIYEIESNEVTFAFSIKPPWYRTFFAKILYLFLAIGLVYIVVYLNSIRLKKLNFRLEKIISNRTAEIQSKNQTLQQQKEEILVQAEQLENTNKELHKLSIVASETDNSVLIMDAKGNLDWANAGFARLYGYTLPEFIEKYGSNLINVSTNLEITTNINTCIKEKKAVIYESDFINKSGQYVWLHTTLTPIFDENENISMLVAIESDIRRHKQIEDEIIQKNKELMSKNERLNNANAKLISTLQKLKQTQSQLVQSEKMASLGVLSAGIAHEINNPINFVYVGINSLKKDYDDLVSILVEIQKLTPENKSNYEIIISEILKIKETNYFDDILESIPLTIKDIQIGAERTAEIVRGMRTFASAENKLWEEFDIHKSIDNSLVLLNNSYKNRIEIDKNYEKDLPLIQCLPSKLNMVFMNIIKNAIDAISNKGKIEITTSIENEYIKILFKDSGSGIDKKNKSKLFDPFFTTKDVGKGVGLGLSITYGIIKEHKGTIEVNSELGKGSEFVIKLPMKQEGK